jgi:hypothetical protein
VRRALSSSVDASERVVSEFYGSTNNSERAVFRAAALCSDERGISRRARRERNLTPNSGKAALQISSQRTGNGPHHPRLHRRSLEGKHRAFFDLHRATLRVNDENVYPCHTRERSSDQAVIGARGDVETTRPARVKISEARARPL